MTFTVTELIGILGVIIGVSGLAANTMRSLWRKVTEISTQLSDFKLEVAEKYVNSQRLMDMEQKMLLSEERLHGSLENLSSRIDRLLEKMERNR